MGVMILTTLGQQHCRFKVVGGRIIAPCEKDLMEEYVKQEFIKEEFCK